jgi:hypothetical protein
MRKIFLTVVVISFFLVLNAQQADSVFMFSYFNNNGNDGLHLAYSNDGYNWTALNNDRSLLLPVLSKDSLMRDPCIIRGAAKQIAEQEGAYFIDLNELIAAKYEEMGEQEVHKFFPADHTHTNLEGAKLNAEIVASALKKINPGKIKKYMSK